MKNCGLHTERGDGSSVGGHSFGVGGRVPGRGWVVTALGSEDGYLWSSVRCECSSKILVCVFLGY